MGIIFGREKECDCCKASSKDTKDVCPNCFELLLRNQTIETQVKAKMDEQDLRWLEKNKRNNPNEKVFNESEYKKL
jgi:predicted amidophosphoribosyltransferase